MFKKADLNIYIYIDRKIFFRISSSLFTKYFAHSFIHFDVMKGKSLMLKDLVA